MQTDKLYKLLMDKGGGGERTFKSATTLCRLRSWPLRQCLLLYVPLLLILVVFTVKTRPMPNAYIQQGNQEVNQEKAPDVTQQGRQQRIAEYCQ